MFKISPEVAKEVKIYVCVIILQFRFAGFFVIAKAALNEGMSTYVFSVYRNAIAAVIFVPLAFVLERKIRPRMTWPILLRIVFLGLLDPVINQNLLYAGMKYASATFTSAMCNVLPAITFIMAWMFSMEKVNIRKIHSQAKISGTLVTVGGGLIMTLIRGSEIGLPWTKSTHNTAHSSSSTSTTEQSPMLGALMITGSNVGYALFYILQARILKSYPAGLSLTALICTFGSLQAAALALVMERGNNVVWVVGWDAKLLAYVYGGIISSGITYYLSGVIMNEKGPVFATAFNPLNMVIVAVLSSFIFAETLDVGKITGALVIIVGLYLVIWGKTKDPKDVADTKQVQEQQLPEIDPSKNTVIKSSDAIASRTIDDNNV